MLINAPRPTYMVENGNFVITRFLKVLGIQYINKSNINLLILNRLSYNLSFQHVPVVRYGQMGQKLLFAARAKLQWPSATPKHCPILFKFHTVVIWHEPHHQKKKWASQLTIFKVLGRIAHPIGGGWVISPFAAKWTKNRTNLAYIFSNLDKTGTGL